MPKFFIRSTLYNLCFYVLTGGACVALLPTLILPRRFFMGVVHGFVWSNFLLEKYILGLTYEVRGAENLPTEGAYIVASKHQSAYETLKLHLLFKDPAVVLKKELLRIPLWGWYLAKSDVIAIDRSTPKSAIKSIQKGAQRMAAQGRAIIIFPQGTRVSTEATIKERPYKIGVVRMQDATGLPIVPMALNTGIFSARHSWIKKPGRVIFDFLPPVMPSDNASETLKFIEMSVEERTHRLMEEGRASIPSKGSKKALIVLPVILFAAYSAYWFYAANLTQHAIIRFMAQLQEDPTFEQTQLSPPHASGFPFKLKLDFGAQMLRTYDGTLEISHLRAQGWPILGLPIEVESGPVTVSTPRWPQKVNFDRFSGVFTYKNDVLDIAHAGLQRGDFKSGISGAINFHTKPYPDLDLTLTLKNHAAYLMELVRKKIIKEKPAMFAGAVLSALQKDGVVTTTITRQNNVIYLGPLRIAELPRIRD